MSPRRTQDVAVPAGRAAVAARAAATTTRPRASPSRRATATGPSPARRGAASRSRAGRRRHRRASAPAAHEPRRQEREREHAEVLYGRNPIFEALRAGRREIKRIWATAGAAKEPWLDGVLLEPADGDWLTQRCGSDAHQGLVADVGPYPYADPASLFSGPAPLIVALDEIQDPQNLGAIARSAEAAGASGIVIPQPAQRRGHRRGGQGVGRRGRAPQDRPGPQPGRLPRRGQGRRLLGLRRGGQGPPVPRARLHRRRRAGHGRRGHGPAPARRARCATTSSRCRCAAGSTRSTSRRPPRCCSTASLTRAPRLAESAPSQESLHRLDEAP